MSDELPKGRIAVTGTFTAKFTAEGLEALHALAAKDDSYQRAFDAARFSGLPVNITCGGEVWYTVYPDGSYMPAP